VCDVKLHIGISYRYLVNYLFSHFIIISLLINELLCGQYVSMCNTEPNFIKVDYLKTAFNLLCLFHKEMKVDIVSS
jgi:hypothetical protein